MAKRERNWKPDIYDMAADRPAAAVPASSPAPPVAAATTDAEGGEEVVAATPVVAPGPVRERVVVVRERPARGDNATLTGLVAGALVGAALTLLIAPLDGAELRRRLQARLQNGPSGGAEPVGEPAPAATVVAQIVPKMTVRGGDTPPADERQGS